ncbi:MAG: response regulator, partial [Flavisolibacter sp.]
MTKQISILLVDDDPDDVFLFEEVLKGIDPTVDFQTASDGEQALDQLTHAKHRILPDLIFLDLNMPRMDGRLCLKKLKETPHSVTYL